ncbi:hypothetical protein MTYP_01046 [Methylophilaceae bacterium]|nr:hypothetical protein MTYP_01046 [Methylophilaceae bacterium]
MADKFQLKAVISAVDKLTPTLKGIALQGKIVRKSLGDITKGTATLLKGLGVGGAAVAGGIFGMIKSVIGESAKFERFESALASIEGSAEAARKAISWVDKFANDTPYDLDEVVRAYTTLRGAGLDPTVGALEAVGNAAAGTNHTVEEAANAFRNALMGENDSLKQFNVTAQKDGNRFAYTYFKNGKKMVAFAKANSREMIDATLTGIFNDMYPDAAKNLSKTYDGLTAMAKDYYTRFLRTIGDKGVFDKIKGQLKGLLDIFDGWVQSGQFDALAQQISDDLVHVIEELSTWVRSVDWPAFYNSLKETISSVRSFISAIGGLKTILIALGVVMLAGPVSAIGQIIFGIWKLIPALFALGKAFAFLLLSNPILLAIGVAIAAIAGAAYLIYKNWEPIKAWFKELWENIKTIADQVWEHLKTIFAWSPLGLILRSWGPVLRFFGNLWDKVKDIAGSAPGMNLTAQAPQTGGAGGGSNFGNLNNKTQLNGEMTVRFENAPPGMRVEPGKTNQPGVGMNPDVGYRPLSVFGM